MELRPIRTDADYQAALAEADALMGAEAGTLAADRLEVLALLIEAYEDRHWPIDPPDPLEAIKFGMEQKGYTQADFARLIGSRPRASEILARKRHLTLPMIWKLAQEWGIPAGALVRPYKLKAARRRAA